MSETKRRSIDILRQIFFPLFLIALIGVFAAAMQIFVDPRPQYRTGTLDRSLKSCEDMIAYQLKDAVKSYKIEPRKFTPKIYYENDPGYYSRNIDFSVITPFNDRKIGYCQFVYDPRKDEAIYFGIVIDGKGYGFHSFND